MKQLFDWKFLAAGFVILGLALADPRVMIAADPPAAQPDRSPQEQAILAALEKPVEISAVKQPLQAALSDLAKKTDVNILLDERAIHEVGIDPKTPMTLQLEGVKLRSILRLLLREADLTYVVRDDALLVTTPEGANSRLVAQVYPVEDLAADPARPGEPPDVEGLVRIIQSTISPTTWSHAGGPAEMSTLKRTLVVSQTPEAHEEIADLLATLRRAKASYDKWNGRDRPIPDLPPTNYWPSNFEKLPWLPLLAKPISVSFREMPIMDAAAKLRELTKVPIWVDEKSLKDTGIGGDIKVTFSCHHMPLKSVLRNMLREHDLTYVIRDEILLITVPEEANCRLITVVVPIFDLAAPPMMVDLADAQPNGADSVDRLIRVIKSTLAPTLWDDEDGPGRIDFHAASGSLIISQHHEVMEELTPLLSQLRRATPVAKKVDPAAFDRELITAVHGPFLRMLKPPIPTGNGKRPDILPAVLFPLPPAELARGIQATIEPESWKDEKSGVRLEVLSDRLLIRHTRHVHARIARLMESLGTNSANDALPPREKKVAYDPDWERKNLGSQPNAPAPAAAPAPAPAPAPAEPASSDVPEKSTPKNPAPPIDADPFGPKPAPADPFAPAPTPADPFAPAPAPSAKPKP